jgi:hypothetical protein
VSDIWPAGRGAARPRSGSVTAPGWFAGALLAGLVLAACGRTPEGNFSQRPGFARWYEANPPAATLPSPADQALLERYRPRFFLPAGNEGPLDFYRDYVAHGTLFGADGRELSSTVTQEDLNQVEREPHVVFVHEPAGAAPTPVVYGRVDRAPLELAGCGRALPVTFLTYHLAFRASGLPAGLPGWQELLLGLIADLDDWHQLDHYTAVTIALAGGGDGRVRPFAATFQQHNYLRTYILSGTGGGGGLPLPADGRLPVDVAIRSNELYPHLPERTRRRAVRFLDPASAVYLVTGEEQPFAASDDITDPASAIEPALRFLPPADAFYVFQGWLGERRLLPGRSGPPGADYNTLPAFKPKPVQLMAFFWGEDDHDFLELIRTTFARGRPDEVDIIPFVGRFTSALEVMCRPSVRSRTGGGSR